MENESINPDLTLYRTYYREEDKQETIDCIKAINTNDTSYPLSANLNPYWSEFALMKEIWEKGKTTEYIGFDQYHKNSVLILLCIIQNISDLDANLFSGKPYISNFVITIFRKIWIMF